MFMANLSILKVRNFNTKHICMNIKEESLKKALTVARLPELPKQFREDNNEYWMEAVILTRKRDGSLSYAIGKRNESGKICYVADFGTMSQIIGLVSIHPYIYLDKKKYMPYETIIQKRNALVMFIGGDNDALSAVQKMSDEDVESSLLCIAIEAQYSNKDITTTHDSIIASVNGNSAIHGEKNEPLKTEDVDMQEKNDNVINVSKSELGKHKRISKKQQLSETHSRKRN